MTDFSVGWHQSSEPIVGHTDGRNALPLAAVFKASLGEDSDLLNCEVWLHVWVWRREEISVVQEDLLHAFDSTFVDSEGGSTCNVDGEVVNVFDSCWISGQIACLSLPVSLVVWGDDNNLLSKVGESDRELINHDTKTSDC